jgi:hypothetical protein
MGVKSHPTKKKKQLLFGFDHGMTFFMVLHILRYADRRNGDVLWGISIVSHVWGSVTNNNNGFWIG